MKKINLGFLITFISLSLACAPLEKGVYVEYFEYDCNTYADTLIISDSICIYKNNNDIESYEKRTDVIGRREIVFVDTSKLYFDTVSYHPEYTFLKIKKRKNKIVVKFKYESCFGVSKWRKEFVLLSD